jgi:hypothetical protein
MEKQDRKSDNLAPINRQIRMGYVGGGFLAQNAHLVNFSTLPKCNLVALAELRPDLASQVAQRFGINKVYPDHAAGASNVGIVMDTFHFYRAGVTDITPYPPGRARKNSEPSTFHRSNCYRRESAGSRVVRGQK